MMSRVKKGMIAGFAATLAVSVLELVNMMLGSPVMSFPAIVASMLGMPGNLAVGWIAHLISGTVILGGLFGYLCPRIPTTTPATKGIAFAIGAMVVMMTAVFLFGDPRMFRGSDGFGTIAWVLFTHAVFGVVLGNVYAALVARERRAASMAHAQPAH